MPSWIKPALWGVVAGAIAWWIVLGAGLGWVSPTTAQKMASDKVQAAVVAVASPYCVSRFEQQANAVASWQALKKSASDYTQDDFIKKGGWAMLPGAKLDSDVADAIASACATNLLSLKEINGVKLDTTTVKS
jgi:hypothetical protein